jgi:hypothetical protein
VFYLALGSLQVLSGYQGSRHAVATAPRIGLA